MTQLAQTTTQVPGHQQRYRWLELSLLILPGIILVLCMLQLLLTNLDPNASLNFKQLPIGDGLIPILGFVAAT